MVENLSCIECDEVITEPFCAICFKKRTLVWLGEQDISYFVKGKIKEQLKELIRITQVLPFTTNRCIICSRLLTSICDYCLMKRFIGILRDNGIKNNEENAVFNYHVYEYGLQRGWR